MIWQVIEIQALPADLPLDHVLFSQENKCAVEFCWEFNTVILETNLNNVNSINMAFFFLILPSD